MNRLLALIFIISFLAFSQNQQDNNLYFTAHNFERAGNLERAKEIYSELYSRNRGNFQYFDALNRTLVQMKDYESSVLLIEERIKTSPGDVNLFGLLGKTYHIAGDEAKAFSAWEKAADLAAGNPAIYKLVSNFAVERREFRKAVEYLQKGKEVPGADETFSYDLANIYALLMQYDDAADEFCSVLLIKPEQYNLVESRIMQYINKPEALSKTIEAVEDYKKNSAVNNLLGRLYMQAKDFEKAYNVFMDLEEQAQTAGAELFKFAQLAFAEGEFLFAARAYNEIIERDPESPYVPAAKLGYARTLESGVIGAANKRVIGSAPVYKIKEPEKLEEVISAYEELVRLYSVTEVGIESNYRIGILKFHYQNKPEEAEVYFYNVIKTSPFSRFALDSHSEIGEIHLSKGELKEAYNSFTKITADERAPVDKKTAAEYRLAQIKFYEGDFPESRRILSGLLQNLMEYSANDAIELSLLLNTAMNDSSNLLAFSHAELLGLQKNYVSAAEEYRKVYSNQGVFMIQHLAKIREAEMELAMNSTENAVVLLRNIADEKEKNIYADKALYLLGKIYQDTLGDPVKAVEIYEDLLVKFPNSLYIDDAREEILKIRNKLS